MIVFSLWCLLSLLVQGGCDEEMSVFLYTRQVALETIRELQGKETGLREHGEFIKVRIVPYRELWRRTADAKVLMSIGLYEMAQRDGLLPRHSYQSQESLKRNDQVD